MNRILTLILAALLLSACAPAVVAPATIEPPAAVSTPTAYTPPVKEVEMATQTPAAPVTAANAGAPAVDPDLPAPTTTPVSLPKTLAELGIPATTYEDRVSGFAFEYPTGWIINSLPDTDKQNSYIYTISLRSKEITPGPKQQEGVPPDLAAIDVSVQKNGPKTLEQAVNERRASATTSESGQPVIIALEEEWTLPGGLRAHRFLYNLGKDASGRAQMTSELVTLINGKMVLVNGFGDQSLFNIVAASLHELK